MSILDVSQPRRAALATAAAPRIEPTRRRGERPPLRLVEPSAPARPKLRVGLISTALLAVIVVGLFVLAAAHTLVVQAQFQIVEIEGDLAERQGELEALRLEVARAESPQNIVSAAREIGMVVPEERLFLAPVQGGS